MYDVVGTRVDCMIPVETADDDDGGISSVSVPTEGCSSVPAGCSYDLDTPADEKFEFYN